MKAYIKKENSKHYLLCSVKDRMFLIDDYTGDIEPGDCFDLGNSLRDNWYKYCCFQKKGKVHIAGEIRSEKEFDNI